MKRLIATCVLVLMACGRNGLELPGEVPPPVAAPRPTPISGRVIDQFGAGVANVPVAAGGPATLSDGNGAFVFAGVTAPYTLAVAAADADQVLVYDGLTSAAPVVRIAVAAATHMSNMTMLVSGLGFQSGGADLVSRWSGGSPALVYYALDDEVAGAAPSLPSGATFGQYWQGASGGGITIDFLQYDQAPSSGPPFIATGFHAFGSGSTFVSDGSASYVSVQTLPITTATLAGTTTLPDGYTITARVLSLARPFGMVYPFGAQLTFTDDLSETQAPPPLPRDFTYAVPAGTGLDVVFEAQARGADDSASTVWLRNPAAPLTVAMPAAATLLAPADGAASVDAATPFSWAVSDGGAHAWSLTLPSKLTITVYTLGTQATLPDLAALGYAIPPATPCEWAVSSFGPVGALDDLVRATYRFPGSFATSSAPRTFTTRRPAF